MKEAAILAVGMCILGYSLHSAILGFKDRDRVVSVRGFSEREVPANKVTWPLVYKVLGDDMGAIYQEVKSKNQVILTYLRAHGLTEKEIQTNAPEIVDMAANAYNTNPVKYRYNVTSVITVTSMQVEKVRKLIEQQAELLTQGVALSAGDYNYRVSYDYTGLSSIKPTMIGQATTDARQAAEKFAKDSESEVGKIKEARQGQFTIEDRDAHTPYIKTVRVVTNVEYYLED